MSGLQSRSDADQQPFHFHATGVRRETPMNAKTFFAIALALFLSAMAINPVLASSWTQKDGGLIQYSGDTTLDEINAATLQVALEMGDIDVEKWLISTGDGNPGPGEYTYKGLVGNPRIGPYVQPPKLLLDGSIRCTFALIREVKFLSGDTGKVTVYNLIARIKVSYVHNEGLRAGQVNIETDVLNWFLKEDEDALMAYLKEWGALVSG